MSARSSLALVTVLVAAVSCTLAGGRKSGFLRMADESQPIHDLAPIIERTCDATRSESLDAGELMLRFPSACAETIGPVVELLRAGFDELAELAAPLPVRVDSTVIVLDNRDLPGNVRLMAKGHVLVVPAPSGCVASGWWKQEGTWATLVRYFFHETAHAALAEAAPRGTPRWLSEGFAEYVEQRIDEALSASVLGRTIDSDAVVARFLSNSAGDAERVLERRRPFAMKLDVAEEAMHAYDLYLGAFLASERLGESLFRTMIDLAGSDASRRQRVRRLRAIDPLEIQASGRRLRIEPR